MYEHPCTVEGKYTYRISSVSNVLLKHEVQNVITFFLDYCVGK